MSEIGQEEGERGNCRDGGENDRIGGALSLRDDERFVVFVASFYLRACFN